jgi:hypothetical protein
MYLFVLVVPHTVWPIIDIPIVEPANEKALLEAVESWGLGFHSVSKHVLPHVHPYFSGTRIHNDLPSKNENRGNC